MAINTSLLISAPVLQEYLVDKDTGLPLSAGVVTFYEDSQRNILKNWYYQATNSAPYSFVAGPNPLTLSGIGAFVDAQGNDIIPMFYPYDETNSNTLSPYFVTVKNSNGELQFTRQNFPFQPAQNQPGNVVPALQNYLTNNEFWRNFGSASLVTPTGTTTINGTNYLFQTLAPSAHDGFSMPDLVILKDIAGASDTLTFQKFPSGSPSNAVLVNDITPEYYLEWNCIAFQGGQNLKCIQFPLQLHIKALENEEATIVFHGKNNGPGALNQIVVQILQYTGTGQTNSSFIPVQTFTLNNTWKKFTTTFILPTADSLPLSASGDDALYIQFVFPATQTFDIFFAKPQLYLSTEIPTNQWDTYDQIDAVINTPRTGDVRISLNPFQPFGWMTMNDGTIGSPASGSTRSNVDTWQLFNLLWKTFNANQALAPMFTSVGTPVAYGGSPIADFSANNRLSLTKTAGRALANVGLPSSGGSGITWALGQVIGTESEVLTVSNMPASVPFANTGIFSTQSVATGIDTNVPGGASGWSPGTATPIFVLQPTAYMNVFIKL